MEKRIFRMPEFIKKVPADKRAELILETLDHLIGDLIATDYSNYEATHGPVVIFSVVAATYLYLTSRNPLARAKIEVHLDIRSGPQRLTQRQFTLHLLRAILLSGEMDTSLNNGLVNLVVCYFFAWKRSGYTLDLSKQYGFVEGDDGLFKFLQRFTPTTADFESVGGRCKIEHPESIHTASFCGNVVDPDQRILITDPTKFLHNFPYVGAADIFSNNKRISMIRLSKAMSAAHMYNGSPVVSPIAWAIIRRHSVYLPSMESFLVESRHLGPYLRVEALAALRYVQTHVEKPVSFEARVFMEKVFNFSAAEQFRVENIVSTATDQTLYSLARRHRHLDAFNAVHLSNSPTEFSSRRNRSKHPLHGFFRSSGPAAALSMSVWSGPILLLELTLSAAKQLTAHIFSMNGKPQENNETKPRSTSVTAAVLKEKAALLRQRVQASAQQQAPKRGGPQEAHRQSDEPSAPRGKRPGKGDDTSRKVRDPGLAGLGTPDARKVGTQGLGGRVVAPRVTVKKTGASGASRALISSHHADLLRIHRKDPLAFHNLVVKHGGEKRSLVLDDRHAAELGIKLPVNNKKIKDKSWHINTHVYRTDGRFITTPMVTKEFADEFNARAAAYNDMLSAAKDAINKSKGKTPVFPSSLMTDFPPLFNKIGWKSLAASGMKYSPAVLAEVVGRNNMDQEVVDDRVYGPTVVAALLEHEFLEPRQASREWVPSVAPNVDGSTINIVVAHSFAKTGVRERVAPHKDEKSGKLVGSELLAPVDFSAPVSGSSSATLLSGAEMVMVPANPRMIDGSVLSELLEGYQQYRPESVAYEYETACDELEDGAGQMEFLSDPADNIALEVGFAALREGFVRTGSTEFSWWRNAECELTFPLLLWFDASNEDPSLEMPGMLMIQNMLTKTLAVAAASKNFGFVNNHFVYDVRSPEGPSMAYQQFFAESLDLTMTNAVLTQSTPVRVTPTNSGMAASFTGAGVVYWATITIKTDPAGDASWRSWQAGEDEWTSLSYRVIGTQTSMIFWRTLYVAGVPYMCFFPTFADALASNNYESGGNFWLAQATIAAGGVKGFRLQGVSGCLALGSGDY
jgi:hypothetical protein